MGEHFDEPVGENKLRHWSRLATTDPKHTKPFQRAGGFRGTAIRPIWNQYRLTEHFGPCGVGWGTDKPDFTTIEAGGELLVFCTLKCWYIDEDGERAELYGVGGDKALVKRQTGPVADDEAFKKAFTDALGNAFLRIGVSADVHMGMFEDSKYVASMAQMFSGNLAEDGPAVPEQQPAPRGATRAAAPTKPAPHPAAISEGDRPPGIDKFLAGENYEIDPTSRGWSGWERAYLMVCDYATDIDQIMKLENENRKHLAGFREAVRPDVYKHFRSRVEAAEKRLWREPDTSIVDEMSGAA